MPCSPGSLWVAAGRGGQHPREIGVGFLGCGQHGRHLVLDLCGLGGQRVDLLLGPPGGVGRDHRVGGQVDLNMRRRGRVIEKGLQVVLDRADIGGGLARAQRDEEGLLLRQGQRGGRLVDGLLRGLAGFALPCPEHRQVAQGFRRLTAGAGTLRRRL